jgi:hypothetical protein
MPNTFIIMNLELNFKCPKKYEEMTESDQSKFCASCSKTVHDFSQMSKAEVIRFIQSRNGEKVCGHIQKSKLDSEHDRLTIMIRDYVNKNHPSNTIYYLLAAGLLSMVACTTDHATLGDISIVEVDTGLLHEVAEQPKFTVAEGHSTKPAFIQQPAPVIGKFTLGETMLTGDTIIMYDGGLFLAEDELSTMCKTRYAAKMPQFPGGPDSLQAYVRRNLKLSGKLKSEAILDLEFTVEKDGSLSQMEIVRSKGIGQQDKEAFLNILRKMPHWIPAEEEGEIIALRFSLPLRIVSE